MIALDVMGGDFSPNASLAGALGASKKNIPILLCGPEKTIISSLNALDHSWKSYPLEIYDAPEVVTMNDSPVEVLTKKRSSLLASIQQVKQGRALSCVSAGNSGAFMVAATLLLGKKKNIERPAIGGFLPALHHPVFCLDLGANSDCKPHYLLQFAELGLEYLASITPAQKNFKIGLLSNGSEEGKGSTLLKEAYKLLKNSPLPFVGNVEPHDVFNNTIDIVVCDGLSGNILLKTSEAVSEMVFNRITKELAKKPIPHVDTFLTTSIQPYFDWRTQGGALLLGVNFPVVVAHGASNAYALENALAFAWKTHSLSKEQKPSQPIQEVL